VRDKLATTMMCCGRGNLRHADAAFRKYAKHQHKKASRTYRRQLILEGLAEIDEIVADREAQAAEDYWEMFRADSIEFNRTPDVVLHHGLWDFLPRTAV